MDEDSRRSKKVINTLLPLLTFLIAITVWHAVAVSGLFLPTLLPSPVAVIQAAVELLEAGVLARHIAASLFRVFTGFGLAIVLAIPLGLLMGRYEILHRATNPLIQTLRPISPIAWIPLAILWFGIGNQPAIFIIFITSFFPILLASASAVRNIDPIIIRSAQNFGANGWDILTKIILPATFPYVVVGLRIALGIAWVIIVAAEMVGMRSGLGFLILDARNFLRTDMVVAGMLIIGLIGFSLDRIMVYLENRIRRRWGYTEAMTEG